MLVNGVCQIIIIIRDNTSALAKILLSVEKFLIVVELLLHRG